MMPTADEVAVAIIAAAKETGADPLAVASGERRRPGAGGLAEIGRARYYAAWALHQVFDGASLPSISRMVGAESPQNFLGNVKAQLNNGKLKWWNNGVAQRVIVAIERMHYLRSPPIQRPFVSDRQTKAYDMLREAVANIARLQGGE